MRKFFPIVFILIAVAACSDARYYVSPDGNDSASGSSHKPLASLDGALARIRSDREKGRSSGPVEIIMKAGEYGILTPVRFGPADTCIAVSGAGMGKTVVSGGLALPAFKEKDGVWVADLSNSLAGKTGFQQLYVGGVRATPARTPNDGELFVTNPVDEQIIWQPADRRNRTGLAVQKMKLSDGMFKALADIPSVPKRVRATFLHKWDVTRRYIYAIEPQDSTMFITASPMYSWVTMDSCSQCYFDNDASFLDAPGEWFYDTVSCMLYYIPREGEHISSTVATVPVADGFLMIEGTEDNRVHDLSFSGVSFKYCSYYMDWKGEDPQQAAASSEASVMLDFADKVKFDRCEIACTGNNGIWFRNSCRNSSLESCYVHDLGIGGVKIGTLAIPEDEDNCLTKCITVDNNIIRTGSRVRETGVGVTLFQASDCRITHNDVSDFNYSGMSIGWVWGYSHSPSKRNIVNYNHIHHIGWGVLSDMGGVYTLGTSEGTEVSHNCIHDIYSYGYGGWGLYTDEGSTGIRMEYNLVYNCKSSSFHQHYGKENVIANNILVNGIKAQMEATRPEDHTSFTFCNNIICYTSGVMYGINWDHVNFDSHDNLYWHYGDSVSFNGLPLEAWQLATGKDKGSVVADPGFRDLDSGDFTITETGLVTRLGFKIFDWRESGVYGEESWRALAQTDPELDARFKSMVEYYESL